MSILSIASDSDILKHSHGEVVNFKRHYNKGHKSVAEIGGLFCPIIFGPEEPYTCLCGIQKKLIEKTTCPVCKVDYVDSTERKQRMGHIDLGIKIISNPLFYKVIGPILGLSPTALSKFCLGSEGDITFELVYDQEGELWAEDGSRYFIEILGKEEGSIWTPNELYEKMKEYGIDGRKTLEKSKTEIGIHYYNLGKSVYDLFNQYVYVTPPADRDRRIINSRIVYAEENIIYLRLIREKYRIERVLIEDTMDDITRKRFMQFESKMIHNLLDKFYIKGFTFGRASEDGKLSKFGSKQGLFRQNLLGKRVDFSGRSVITSGPFLRPDEVGIPMPMLHELFKPILIRELAKRLRIEDKRFNQYKALKLARKEHEEFTERVKKLIEEICPKYDVFMNRAPSLHRYSVMGHRIRVTYDKCILFPAMTVGPYGADFDGDCLHGSTIIPTLDGKHRTMLELIEEEGIGSNIWVYSLDEKTNRVVPGKAKILGCSGHKDKYVEITLDNGAIEKCSVDHKWLMRDGSWKRAEGLVSGDRLMPLYRSINSSGYEEIRHPVNDVYIPQKTNIGGFIMNVVQGIYLSGGELNKETYTENRLVYNGSKATPHWETALDHYGVSSAEELLEVYLQSRGIIEETHKAVAKCIYPEYASDNGTYTRPDRLVVHHNAKTSEGVWDKLNNSPESLKIMTSYDHNKFHYQEMGKNFIENEELQKYQKERHAKRHEVCNDLKKNSALINMYSLGDRVYWANILSNYPINDYWRKCLRNMITQDTFIWFVTEELGFTRDNLRELRRGRLSIEDILSGDYTKSVPKEVDISEFPHVTKLDGRIGNHKVVSVRIVEETIPTYDLEVEKYHNFATGGGVFTHNTLSVHLPVTFESMKECRELFHVRKHVMQSKHDSPNIGFSNEMTVGSYLLTRYWEKPSQEFVGAYNSRNEVEKLYQQGILNIDSVIKFYNKDDSFGPIESYITSVGSILVEQIAGLKVDWVLNKSGAGKLISKVNWKNSEDCDKVVQILHKLQTLFFETSTKSGISIKYEDTLKSEETTKRLESSVSESMEYEGFERTKFWDKIMNEECDRWFNEVPHDHSLYIMGQSGARVQEPQVKTMIVGKSLLRKPISDKYPMGISVNAIIHSLSEGLNPIEYMETCGPARLAFAQNAFFVPASGYLERQVVQAGRNLCITTEDCGNTDYLPFEKELCVGMIDKDYGMVTAEMLPNLPKILHVRTPITCKHDNGLCQHCCGQDPATRKFWKLGTNIGVITGQVILERTTQKSLSGKHTSGILRVDQIGKNSDDAIVKFAYLVGGKLTTMGLNKDIETDKFVDIEGESYEEKAVNFVKKIISQTGNDVLTYATTLVRAMSDPVELSSGRFALRSRGASCKDPKIYTVHQAILNDPSWLRKLGYGYTRKVLERALAYGESIQKTSSEQIMRGKLIHDCFGR